MQNFSMSYDNKTDCLNVWVVHAPIKATVEKIEDDIFVARLDGVIVGLLVANFSKQNQPIISVWQNANEVDIGRFVEVAGEEAKWQLVHVTFGAGENGEYVPVTEMVAPECTGFVRPPE